VHNFLVIGVPLLSVALYVFIAGLIHGLAVKWMRKTDWHQRRGHSSGYKKQEDWCDDCSLTAGAGAGLWPISALFLMGSVLATKKRLRKAERLAKRIADLEKEAFTRAG
jgi:hypothetical protein